MLRTLAFILLFQLPPIAYAQDHHNAHSYGSGDHNHANHDHSTKSEHTDHGHQNASNIVISRNADIDAALAQGGTSIVVQVLGVVCDFCAKAMNKTFGRRDDVAAVYVDLDTKTLNLVLTKNSTMDDSEIKHVVRRSGYKTKVIHRGAHLTGEKNAPDPS